MKNLQPLVYPDTFIPAQAGLTKKLFLAYPSFCQRLKIIMQEPGTKNTLKLSDNAAHNPLPLLQGW